MLRWVLLLILVSFCSAWGPVVHYAIGKMAQEQLSIQSAMTIGKILSGKSLEDVVQMSDWICAEPCFLASDEVLKCDDKVSELVQYVLTAGDSFRPRIFDGSVLVEVDSDWVSLDSLWDGFLVEKRITQDFGMSLAKWLDYLRNFRGPIKRIPRQSAPDWNGDIEQYYRDSIGMIEYDIVAAAWNIAHSLNERFSNV